MTSVSRHGVTDNNIPDVLPQILISWLLNVFKKLSEVLLHASRCHFNRDFIEIGLSHPFSEHHCRTSKHLIALFFFIMASAKKPNAISSALNQTNRHELLGNGGTSGITNPGYNSGNHSPTGQPMSEMQQINLKINQTTDQSLDSTRRMVRLVEESAEAGAKTMVNLDRQGEQLRNVEENLDNMNQDLREAERNMEQMEKWCGLCVCPWRKRRNFEKSASYQKNFGSEPQSDREQLRLDQPRGASPNMNANGQKGQFINRITNDAREDEMEENLEAVSGMLGNLKNMAVDMGQTINDQNKQLDRMHNKTDLVNTRVVTANTRATDILKKA